MPRALRSQTFNLAHVFSPPPRCKYKIKEKKPKCEITDSKPICTQSRLQIHHKCNYLDGRRMKHQFHKTCDCHTKQRKVWVPKRHPPNQTTTSPPYKHKQEEQPQEDLKRDNSTSMQNKSVLHDNGNILDEVPDDELQWMTE